MRATYLNHTSRNHGQAARSSTCCGRQVISTGRFSRRRRSSSPESAQAFSDSEPTRRYAMQTVEAGFPTRTTPLRWSTRSNGRAIPGAGSRSDTDAAANRATAFAAKRRGSTGQRYLQPRNKTQRAAGSKSGSQFKTAHIAQERGGADVECKGDAVSHYSGHDLHQRGPCRKEI